MKQIDAALRQAFCPSGPLRACINTGNRVLAHLDAQGQPAGVTVDLARDLASRLGADLELVVVDAAGKSVEMVSQRKADVGFFAIDPLRATDVSFTEPYVLIEGCYMVRTDSPILDAAQVDQPGITVVVGKGSAYDLYLTRNLTQATLEKAPTSPLVTQTFLSSTADVAAGVRQQLELDIERTGGLRLLPGRFMVIRQAVGVNRAAGDEAARWLTAFVEARKADGFVADALRRHAVEGAAVAPPAP
jgi:ABC-type amino acid transport substrate-binding protein